MASIFDQISKRLKGRDAQPGGPQIGRSQIQKAIQAKGGQVAGGVGPRASGIAADVTRDRTRAAAGQQQASGAMAAGQLQQQARTQAAQMAGAQRELQQRGQLARQDLVGRESISAAQRQAAEADAAAKRTAQEEMQQQQLESAYTTRLRQLEAQRDIALNDLFGEFGRSQQDLENRKDAAELEQMAHVMALSDRQYLDELDRIGKERNLRSDMAFREETARTVLGESTKNLMDDLEWTADFNAQQRDWERQLTQMSAGQAIELARSQIADSNRRAVVAGVGKILQAGTSYAVGEGLFDSPPAAGEAPGFSQPGFGQGYTKTAESAIMTPGSEDIGTNILRTTGNR